MEKYSLPLSFIEEDFASLKKLHQLLHYGHGGGKIKIADNELFQNS